MASHNVRHRPPRRGRRPLASRRGNITRRQENGRYIQVRDAGRGHTAFLHATKGWRVTRSDVGENLTQALLRRWYICDLLRRTGFFSVVQVALAPYIAERWLACNTLTAAGFFTSLTDGAWSMPQPEPA